MLKLSTLLPVIELMKIRKGIKIPCNVNILNVVAFIDLQGTGAVFNHKKSVMSGTFYHNTMYLIYYDN